MSTPTPTETLPAWWINIERERNPDAAVGPFPTHESAVLAMEESILVESLCAEDCTDCYTTPTPPKGKTEQFIVDLNDPDHTGEARDDD